LVLIVKSASEIFFNDKIVKDNLIVYILRHALKKETDFLENQCIKWGSKIDEKAMSEETLVRVICHFFLERGLTLFIRNFQGSDSYCCRFSQAWNGSKRTI